MLESQKTEVRIKDLEAKLEGLNKAAKKPHTNEVENMRAVLRNHYDTLIYQKHIERMQAISEAPHQRMKKTEVKFGF